jgi:hypothetical protein
MASRRLRNRRAMLIQLQSTIEAIDGALVDEREIAEHPADYMEKQSDCRVEFAKARCRFNGYLFAYRFVAAMLVAESNG